MNLKNPASNTASNTAMNPVNVAKFQRFICKNYKNPKGFCDKHKFSKTFIYSLYNGERKRRLHSRLMALCEILGPSFGIKDFD